MLHFGFQEHTFWHLWSQNTFLAPVEPAPERYILRNVVKTLSWKSKMTHVVKLFRKCSNPEISQIGSGSSYWPPIGPHRWQPKKRREAPALALPALSPKADSQSEACEDQGENVLPYPYPPPQFRKQWGFRGFISHLQAAAPCHRPNIQAAAPYHRPPRI